MKTRSFALLFILGSLASVATPQVATTTYAYTVQGGAVPLAEGVFQPLTLNLTVAGESAGTLEATIHYNNTREIVGGEWTFTVLEATAEGSARTLGVLSGSLLRGGRVDLNGDGTPAALADAALAIEKGSGLYDGVTLGGGALAGTFAREAFTGAFSLSY